MLIEKEAEEKTEEIQVDKIEHEIQDLLTQCRMIDTILGKATQISNASSYIHTNLSALHSKIESGLAKIEGYVNK